MIEHKILKVDFDKAIKDLEEIFKRTDFEVSPMQYNIKDEYLEKNNRGYTVHVICKSGSGNKKNLTCYLEKNPKVCFDFYKRIILFESDKLVLHRITMNSAGSPSSKQKYDYHKSSKWYSFTDYKKYSYFSLLLFDKEYLETKDVINEAIKALKGKK